MTKFKVTALVWSPDLGASTATVITREIHAYNPEGAERVISKYYAINNHQAWALVTEMAES